jgi:hypothetical protein
MLPIIPKPAAFTNFQIGRLQLPLKGNQRFPFPKIHHKTARGFDEFLLKRPQLILPPADQPKGRRRLIFPIDYLRQRPPHAGRRPGDHCYAHDSLLSRFISFTPILPNARCFCALYFKFWAQQNTNKKHPAGCFLLIIF